jgi:hypothetical protein
MNNRSQGIYETEAIIKSDLDDRIFLEDIARGMENDGKTGLSIRMYEIVKRWNALTTAAHNRKHWTGHE